MIKHRFIPILCLVFFSGLAAVFDGCTTSDKRSRETRVLQTLEGQVHSEDAAVARQAALTLLSSKLESAFRLLKNTLVTSDSSTTRGAVIFAFTVQNDRRIRVESADALGDSDAETVDLAKKYLLDVIGESAAPDILSRARDDARGSSERVAAIEVLGKYATKGSVEGLLDLLEDSDQDVANAAAAALREITYQPFGASPALWRSWYQDYKKLSRDEWRQAAIFFANEREKDKEQIQALEDVHSASEREVVTLAKKIVDIGVELRRPQMVLDVLIEVKPVEAQIYAAEKLGRLKAATAVVPLIEKAASSQPRLAEAAISALGQIGDPKALAAVASRLPDEDTSVRLAAVKAYAALPESDLARILPLADDASADIRAEVARSLGERKWEVGLAPLLEMLSDEVPEVRAAAAQALGPIGDKAAVPELVTLVDDADSNVAFYAVRSLSLLPDASAYDALIRATAHTDPRVREAAVVALEKVALEKPDDKRAVERLFELSFSRTETDQRVAESAWNALLVLIDRDAELILQLSQRLEDADRFDKAEGLLRILVDSKADDKHVLEALRRLAGANLARRNYEAALGYFRRILQTARDDAQALSGERAALEGLEDYKGLAAFYAGEMAAGRAADEDRRRFLKVLGKLLDTEDYWAVVTFSDQVLGGDNTADGTFKAAVVEIRQSALPGYLGKLVGDLAGDDEAAIAAHNALSSYGRDAA
ncbi:MAG: HEAT repeat domain-containing protein, partial [Planctomycetes bacterium]|nr:HEAT repeat domain-containing protein [Planctomycetota bacterium]